MRRAVRTKRFVYFVPWMFACSCLLLSACGSSGGGGGAPASTTEQQTGKEIVVVESIREVGVIESGPSITMQDCGYSARIGDSTVWIFGDSLLDSPNEDDHMMLSNSWSFTYDLDAGDGLAGFQHCVDAVGAPVTLIPLTQAERAYNDGHAAENCTEQPCRTRWAIWPGTIVSDPEKDVAYVFYHKVLVGSGIMKFDNIGDSIAVWEDFSQPAGRPEFNLFEEHPTLLFSNEEPLLAKGFGSAATLVGRLAYIYACKFSEEVMATPCAVARVPIEHILRRDKWMFYDGNGDWSSEILDAELVFHGSNMMSVFYSEYLDLYLAVYSKPMGTKIMLRSAKQPYGPWSDELNLISAETPVNELGWVYDGLAHPEFSPDGGRTIHVTYSRQTKVRESEMRIVEVQLGTRYEAP